MNSKAKIIGLSALLIIISFSVFIFFKGFFDTEITDLTTEILAASLGAIITAIVMATLLTSQAATEEKKEKSLGVFQAKLKYYGELVDFLFDIIEDGELEQSEIKELSKWATRIALIGGRDLCNTMSYFVDQCITFKKFRFEDMTGEDKKILAEKFLKKDASYQPTEQDFVSVGMVVSRLREDLGEAMVSGKGQISAGLDVIDSLVEKIGKQGGI